MSKVDRLSGSQKRKKRGTDSYNGREDHPTWTRRKYGPVATRLEGKEVTEKQKREMKERADK